MRRLALLLVLLLLPLAAAQPEFGNPHQVRIAYGDIPTTTLTEADGVWNIQETVVVAEGESTTWNLPAGHALVGTGCNNCSHTSDGTNAPEYTLGCSSAGGGKCAITVTHAVGGDAHAFGLTQALRPSSIVVVYTAPGAYVHAPLEAVVSFPCASAICDLHQFNTAGLDSFWFTVSPEAPDSTGAAPASGVDGRTVLWAGLTGLVVGVVAWYLLVRLGYVQKRQRKQVAGEAAHKQVAKKEGKATLEGRKRALMAALKELEVAKMNKELDTDAYDALKADFKKETVTVMRALEEAS